MPKTPSLIILIKYVLPTIVILNVTLSICYFGLSALLMDQAVASIALLNAANFTYWGFYFVYLFFFLDDVSVLSTARRLSVFVYVARFLVSRRGFVYNNIFYNVC